MAFLCSQWTPNVQIKYFTFDFSIYRLFVVYGGGKRDSLQIIIFVYICSTWSIVELKARFETWITRNDVNGVSWFHLSFLITLMAYLCSQCTPHVQINYFMFDWLIYRLFVLNRGLVRRRMNYKEFRVKAPGANPSRYWRFCEVFFWTVKMCKQHPLQVLSLWSD
jgi:hypothetical protein